MKRTLLYITLIFCFSDYLVAQEDGVVSFTIPVRNSLTFNRHQLNPTFSFVRESNKVASFTNKREWAQFENAPNTYLFSFAGRLNENMGFGISLFQRNYGVLSTFGGVFNYAYNVALDRDSNLTFGANIGLYQSGINDANVITNFPDPSLNNIPSNFVMTINPGVNYGISFFDFGLSLNNFALYNFTTSRLVEEDPEKAIQAHAMYTGFLRVPGFFDDSKFSALIRSEFKTDNTVISGLMMLTVPKGIWAQVGYNTLYGASVGLGLNITNEIAIEYNYEKALGDLVDLGSAHEITLAYRFKNNRRYDYNDELEQQSIFPKSKKVAPNKTDEATRQRIAARAEARRTNASQPVTSQTTALVAADKAITSKKEITPINTPDESVKAEAKQEARLKTEQAIKDRAEADALAKLEVKAKAEEASRHAIERKAEMEAKSKLDEELKLKATQEARVKAEAEAVALAKLQAEKQAEIDEELRLIQEEEAQLKAQQEAKEKEEEALRLQKEADAKRKLARQRERDSIATLAKLQAEKQAQIDEELRLIEEEEARLKAEALAKAEADKLLKLQQEAEAQKQLAIKREQDSLAALTQKSEAAITLPTDEISESITALANETLASKAKQDELLSQLENTVKERQNDLNDLKEENDLSEKGIYKAPKPFKSVSQENAKLETLKSDLDQLIEEQDEKINELNKLYKQRSEKYPSDDDEMNMIYLDEILIIQSSQKKAKETRDALVLELERIKVNTDIERKRRIKRAAYDNQEDRYEKDMTTLNAIKKFTPKSSIPIEEKNLDFGEEQGSSIRILKGVKNTENGFYLVLAVHSDKTKRDNFVRQVVASGQKDVSFFYDVNTSKYYIYQQKFDNIQSATQAMQQKGTTAINKKLSMIKIEN